MLMGTLFCKQQITNDTKNRMYYDDRKFNETLIIGYFRDIQSSNQHRYDYKEIIGLIESYQQKERSPIFFDKTKWWCADDTSLAKFGDVIKTNDDTNNSAFIYTYSMVTETGTQITLGSCYNTRHGGRCISLYFPFSVCSRFRNVTKYYSKLYCKYSEFQKYEHYSTEFYVAPNDGFIIEQFGGILKGEFDFIQLCFGNNVFQNICLGNNTFSKWFNPRAFKYTSQGFDQFFKLRKHKNEMIKLRVSPKNAYGQCGIYSCSWHIKHDRIGWPPMAYWYYIGPKNEKQQMITKLKECHGSEINISVIAVEKEDYEAIKPNRIKIFIFSFRFV
eukprot:412539_1